MLLPILTVVFLILFAPAHAISGNEVPLNGELSAFDNVSQSPSCPALSSTILGTGVVSHLGRVTAEMHDCFSPAGPPFHFDSGTFTLRAANGDELRGTYSGTLIATPTSAQTGVFAFNDTKFFITGGTGRFQGASGQGTITGFENIFTRQASIVLTGKIDY